SPRPVTGTCKTSPVEPAKLGHRRAFYRAIQRRLAGRPGSAPARRARPEPAPPVLSKAGEECHAHEVTREGNIPGRRRDCSKEPDASQQSTLPDWLQSGVQEVVD